MGKRGAGRYNENRYKVAGPLLLAVLLAATGCSDSGRSSGSPDSIHEQPPAAASTSPAISASGNVIAYVSEEDSLVPDDTNGVADVFVRSGDTTTRVNVTVAGTESQAEASDPAVSGDGRYVVFVSAAPDLVIGDTNGVADVFIRDLVDQVTQRVNVTAAGGESLGAASEPAVSGDGRYVTYVSAAADLVPGDTNGVADVFVRDMVDGTTQRISVASDGAEANGASTSPSISYSGQWIAYASTATNLVPDDTNAVSDVFLSLRAGGNTRRASIPDALTAFEQSNGASGQPRVTDVVDNYPGGGQPLVVYESAATNLVADDTHAANAVFVSTWLFGTEGSTTRISSADVAAHSPDIAVTDSGPGYVVTFVSDTSGSGGDIHVVVRDTPVDPSPVSASVVTEGANGAPANGPSDQPAVSGNGHFVAFMSRAGNLDAASAAYAFDSIYVSRALQPVVNAVEPARVGLMETRDITIRGRGFEPASTVSFDEGMTVNATTFVSPEELIANITATVRHPREDFRTLYVDSPGVAGGRAGAHTALCRNCVQVAAVVEQPGLVAIEIIGGTVRFGTFELDIPSCLLGECPALPGTVTTDGDISFGLESLDFEPIAIPVELSPGLEVTLELVPRFVAPRGKVIPVSGVMNLGLGFAIGIKNALLPATCAFGPVQAELSTTPAGIAYEQTTGLALLAGAFTQELAITGCGLFTSTLNTLLSLPIQLGESSVEIAVRLNPMLTGSVEP